MSKLYVDSIQPKTTGGVINAKGMVIQVVQGSFGTSVTTNSSSYVDTGLTASITPHNSNSKILVMADIMGAGGLISGNPDTHGSFQIVRNSTAIVSTTFRGYDYGSSGLIDFSTINMKWLDTPTTTSTIIYKVQFKRRDSSSSIRINEDHETGGSTITLMEIGG